MQFGMPTLIETKSIESCAALCHELKLDFVELNMNLPKYQAERLDVAKYLDLARTHDRRAVLEVKMAAGLRKSVNWLKERGYICDTNRK